MKRSFVWLSLVSVVLIGLMFSPAASSAAQRAAAPKATPSPTPTLEPPAASNWRWVVANEKSNTEWLTYSSSDYVSTIVIDGDDIWAVGGGGLLRWTRATQTVTQYLAPQVPLPSNNLTDLVLHDGQLYISGDNGVAVFDRDSRWLKYDSASIGLADADFGDMEMIDDVLWVGSDHGLARLYPDGHWNVIQAGPQTFPLPNIERIVPRPDGVYLAIADGEFYNQTKTAVVRYTNDQWSVVTVELPTALTAADGTWWTGEEGQLLKSVDQGKNWTVAYQGDRWIKPLSFDAAGRLYLYEDYAIKILQDDRIVETYRFADVGPELNYVNLIKHDAAGRIWIGTDGRGLTMFDGQQWHNWQPENSAIREDAIRGMAVTDGKVYLGLFGCAGCGGVSIYDVDADHWTNLWPGESELSGGGVGGIAIDAQGRAYFPTSEGVLDIYDNGQWSHIKMTPALRYTVLSAEAGLFDRNGHYWVATSGLGFGVWEYDGEIWRTYLNGYDARALALDAAGRIWVAASQGLAVRDLDQEWYLYTPANSELADEWISTVETDSAGRVWALSNNGLHIFNGKEWEVIKPQTVGAFIWGDDVEFDAQGHAWIGTSDGVAVFRGKPNIDPLVSLSNPAAAPAMPTRVSEDSQPSFWSLVSQSMCLMVGVPGAWAFARLRRIARRRQMRAEERINRS